MSSLSRIVTLPRLGCLEARKRGSVRRDRFTPLYIRFISCIDGRTIGGVEKKMPSAWRRRAVKIASENRSRLSFRAKNSQRPSHVISRWRVEKLSQVLSFFFDRNRKAGRDRPIKSCLPYHRSLHWSLSLSLSLYMRVCAWERERERCF